MIPSTDEPSCVLYECNVCSHSHLYPCSPYIMLLCISITLFCKSRSRDVLFTNMSNLKMGIMVCPVFFLACCLSRCTSCWDSYSCLLEGCTCPFSGVWIHTSFESNGFVMGSIAHHLSVKICAVVLVLFPLISGMETTY